MFKTLSTNLILIVFDAWTDETYRTTEAQKTSTQMNKGTQYK
jgi:hypothetical protein